jgi:glycosyltransferase involved in cell wall biosynthesis
VRAVVDPRIALYETPWVDRSLGSQLRAVRYLKRLVADVQPDVVHLHSSFAGLGGVLGVGSKAPIAYTPQGYSFAQRDSSRLKRAVYIAAERFVARRVTLIGASSEDEGRLAREVARAKRVTVTPNGIHELDDPVGGDASPRDRPRVIALGRIAAQRQPPSTARILASVSDLADVVWVGDGDAADAAVVRDAGVEVSGWVTREQALAELASADVYLHWSAWDGHPVTVLEALARDAVVVASDIGPNREIVGAGQVFASEDDAIAAIRAILTDPSRRRACLDIQHERRVQFSAERLTSRWLELYKELAEPAASASISRP